MIDRSLIFSILIAGVASPVFHRAAAEEGREGTRVRRCAPVPREDDPEKALKRFPPADKGMVRHVIRLDKQDDESLFRVELIVGKTIKDDMVNHLAYCGMIEQVTVPGSGHTRYVVPDLGGMRSTLMGGRGPLVDRFVTLAGGPYLIPYASRLPVVVYVPEGAEVRYRVWRTPPKAAAAPKG
jgi:ecotin